LVNELAAVGGRRGHMDQEENDEGCNLGKHFVVLLGHFALTPSEQLCLTTTQY
jgi:hypothetical protein